jgi:DNA-binding NtrC family response regulator
MQEQDAILIVDDEEGVRDSLAHWLAADGYRVDTAPDGETAIARLAAQAYALLLVDLKMPGLDGLAVLQQARTQQPALPVILMTAYATVDTAVRAMKSGAQDYLVKPFDPEALSQMVEHLLRTQALRTADAQGPAAGERTEAGDPLRDVERRHVQATLTQYAWNISRSAKALQIDRVTLYNKIKRYNIRKDE